MEALAPFGYEPARHHRYLIAKLEAVSRGDIERLMVLMPPGSAKSTYVSVLFPTWFLCQHPDASVIGLSHGADLAESFSRHIMREIKRHADKLGYDLASESVKEWRTTAGGSYRATGVGGSLTGRRAMLTLIDDPVKDQVEAESEVTRAMVWDWYQSVVYTRQVPGARIVLVMTRWHPEDLGGKLLSAGTDHWDVVRLPAFADMPDDPLGRALGEPLWPEREPTEALNRIRANVGEHVFGALYQQDPRPRGSAFFDIQSLLCGGTPAPMPEGCDTVFAVIDTAVKTGKGNDGTAVTFFSFDMARLNAGKRSPAAPAERTLLEIPVFILDWEIVQIDGVMLPEWLPSVFARLEDLSRQCGARMGAQGVYIEDKATGMVLLQHAARAGLDAYPIDGKLTAMGKVERGIAANPYVQGGMVRITEQAYAKTSVYKGRSANHLIDQIIGFRVDSRDGASDDLFDTFTYGLILALGGLAQAA